jgi:hypothetical protein
MYLYPLCPIPRFWRLYALFSNPSLCDIMNMNDDDDDGNTMMANRMMVIQYRFIKIVVALLHIKFWIGPVTWSGMLGGLKFFGRVHQIFGNRD